MPTHGEQMILEQERIQEMVQEVQHRYSDVEFPNPVKEPIWYGRLPSSITRVPGKFAVVDIEKDISFAICSEDYSLVRHEQVIFETLQAVEEMSEYGKPAVHIKFPDGAGGKMVFTVKFPEVELEIRKGDKINPQIEVRNSYDLGWQRHDRFGAFQLICTNGLIAGVVEAEMKRRHLNGVMDTDAFLSNLRQGMDRYSEQTQLWQRWADKQINQKGVLAALGSMPFSEKERQKILDTMIIGQDKTPLELIEAKEMTAWDLHSATTQFLTHEVRSEMRRVEDPERVARVMTTMFH